MFILIPVVLTVVLVFFGYLAMWSAHQSNTPAGIAQFGKIMAIILFVFAGLVLVFGMACRHHHGMQCMKEKMSCCGGMNEKMSYGKEMPFMKGKMYHHGFGMDKQGQPCEKDKMGAPDQEEKTGEK